MENLKQLAEENGGKLPSYAWPGGYPLLYVDGHGEALCPACANSELLKEDAGKYAPVAYDVYYEGPSDYCAVCNSPIESAYGDPESEVS